MLVSSLHQLEVTENMGDLGVVSYLTDEHGNVVIGPTACLSKPLTPNKSKPATSTTPTPKPASTTSLSPTSSTPSEEKPKKKATDEKKREKKKVMKRKGKMPKFLIIYTVHMYNIIYMGYVNEPRKHINLSQCRVLTSAVLPRLCYSETPY